MKKPAQVQALARSLGIAEEERNKALEDDDPIAALIKLIWAVQKTQLEASEIDTPSKAGDSYREPDDYTSLTLPEGGALASIQKGFFEIGKIQKGFSEIDTPGKASLAFGAEVAKFLELQTEEEWRTGLDSLIAAHGKQSVES